MKTSTLKHSKMLLPCLLASALFTSGWVFGGPAAIAAPPVVAPLDLKTLQPLPENAPAAGEINAFLKADKEKMPPRDAVLFAGSSTIRLWASVAKDIPEIPVINRGFGGSQLFENTLYADRIAIPYHPKIIVLFAGTNDLAYGNRSPQQVFEDFQAYVAKIHASLPDTRIVYLSISPTVQRWNNEGKVLETNYLIQKWITANDAPTNKLTYLGTHDQLLGADGKPQPRLLREDGLHLNVEGYKFYTSIVKPRVLALAALDGVPRLDGMESLDAVAEPAKTK